MRTKSNTHTCRDIRSLFPKIAKRTTMLYSEGSVEVNMGHYVEEEDIEAMIDSIKGYRFV